MPDRTDKGSSAPQPTIPPTVTPSPTDPDPCAGPGPDVPDRLGPYRPLRVLGEGGMGAVYLAEDTALARHVALKVMKPALAADPAFQERFLREARSVAALRSDHVVTLYHAGRDAGVLFLAMELLQGETLHSALTHDRPPLREALRIGREIALGLSAAHEKGLVHRDIKPGNVFLEAPSGRVKVLDFGLARGPAAGDGLTHAGAVLGTPAYMPPEQANGQPVDHRADLYSLGCVLYRLVAGVPPFRGGTDLALLAAALHETPRPLREVAPSVPGPLDALVMQLLEKRPEDRPASALEVADRLARIERSLADPASEQPATLPYAPATWAKRSRVVLLAGAILASAALGAGAAAVLPRLFAGKWKAEHGDKVVEKDDRPEPKPEVKLKPEDKSKPVPPTEEQKLAQALEQKEERLLDFDDTQLTLDDALGELERRHKVRFVVDTDAFARAGTENVGSARVSLKPLPRGVTLGTALRFLLAELVPDATYAVTGSRVLVVPGKPPAVKDESGSTPRAKKISGLLAAPTDLFKTIDDASVRLPDVGEILSDRLAVPVLIDRRAFRLAKNDLAEMPFATLLTRGGVPLGAGLQLLLDELGPAVTFTVRRDHLLIHPGQAPAPKEDRSSAAGQAAVKKLAARTEAFKDWFDDPQTTLPDCLEVFEARQTGLPPLLIQRRAFRQKKKDPDKLNVRLKPVASAPAGEILEEALRSAGATYLVRGDHILVVPREK